MNGTLLVLRLHQWGNKMLVVFRQRARPLHLFSFS